MSTLYVDWTLTKHIFSYDPEFIVSGDIMVECSCNVGIGGKVSDGLLVAIQEVVTAFIPTLSGEYEKEVSAEKEKFTATCKYYLNDSHRMEVWSCVEGYGIVFGELTNNYDGTFVVVSSYRGHPFVMTRDLCFCRSDECSGVEEGVGKLELEGINLHLLDKVAQCAERG